MFCVLVLVFVAGEYLVGEGMQGGWRDAAMALITSLVSIAVVIVAVYYLINFLFGRRLKTSALPDAHSRENARERLEVTADHLKFSKVTTKSGTVIDYADIHELRSLKGYTLIKMGIAYMGVPDTAWESVEQKNQFLPYCLERCREETQERSKKGLSHVLR